MQIKRSTLSLCKLWLVLVLGIGAFFSVGAAPGWSQTILTYSQQTSQRKLSSILKSPQGISYRIVLSPEVDTGKHVVVMDLMLQKLGNTKSEGNLLDPTGQLHGYQPYTFAASDFSKGIQKSAFGEIRVIALDRLKMKLTIKVKDAGVSPIFSSSEVAAYQFDALTLEITTNEMAKAIPKSSTP